MTTSTVGSADGGTVAPGRAADLRRVVTAVSGVPVTAGNRLELLRNGVEIFPAMLDAIARAERSVDLLTFVYWTGDVAREFASALAASARRGVRVRVLLDGVGARPLDPGLVEQMASAGADVRFFRPPDPRHPIRALSCSAQMRPGPCRR